MCVYAGVAVGLGVWCVCGREVLRVFFRSFGKLSFQTFRTFEKKAKRKENIFSKNTRYSVKHMSFVCVSAACVGVGVCECGCVGVGVCAGVWLLVS